MKSIIRIQKLGFPWQTQDPFLFCAHHRDLYPAGNGDLGPEAKSLQGRRIGEDFTLKEGWRMYHGQTIPGFPYHPHRGFETITIATEGTIDHFDSLGASGRFSNGDVQWMTAGKGVQHSEMFPLIHPDKENPLEIFQVWLNLPKKDKMVEPHYAMLWAEDVQVATVKDVNGLSTTITVIAGDYLDTKAPRPTPNSWANNPSNGVRVWTIKMEPEGEWALPKAQKNVNRTLFFYSGDEVVIDGEKIGVDHAISLAPEEDITLKSGQKEACFLLLQGKPINEPVAQHGPFVMNTSQEIQQAFADYQQTQFGGWPWDRPDPTHGSENKRFAIYADGTEERKI